MGTVLVAQLYSATKQAPGLHDPGSHDPGSHDPGSHDPGSHDHMWSRITGSHDLGSHDFRKTSSLKKAQ